MNKLTKTSPARFRVLPPTPFALPLTLLLISMSLGACKEVMVISADQTETFVRANQTFQVPVDGVFMPAARYQRYRQAVADRIQENSQNN